MRELLLRAEKGLAAGYPAGKWQRLDQKTGLLVLCFPYMMSPKYRIRNECNLPQIEFRRVPRLFRCIS